MVGASLRPGLPPKGPVVHAPPLAVARPDDRADRVRVAARRGERRATTQTDLPLPNAEAQIERSAQIATLRALVDRKEERRERARREARESDGVVRTAVAQIGDGYAWGGSGPDAFDCSGPDRVRLRPRRDRAAAHVAGPGGDGPSRGP